MTQNPERALLVRGEELIQTLPRRAIQITKSNIVKPYKKNSHSTYIMSSKPYNKLLRSRGKLECHACRESINIGDKCYSRPSTGGKALYHYKCAKQKGYDLP